MASGKFAFMILLVILVAAAICITQKIEQLLMRFTRHMGTRMRKTHGDGIYHLLAPSLICTCVCMVCLCGASWAWFSAAYTSPVTGITAAVYDVEVTVTDSTDGEADVPVTSQNLCCQLSLDAEHIYNVGIRATGTASSGYCSVIIDGTTYYTPQISPNSDFTFTVKANQASTMQIIPQWGTCAVADSNITSGATIEFGTPSDEDPAGAASDSPADTQPAGSPTNLPTDMQPAPQTNSPTSSQSSTPDVQSPVDAQTPTEAQSPTGTQPYNGAQTQASAQPSTGTQPAPSDSSLTNSSSDSQAGSKDDSSASQQNDSSAAATSLESATSPVAEP